MMVTIWDSLSDLPSSGDGEDGEHEDDEETEQGKRREDNELGWVMGTITKTVQQHMETFQLKQMNLQELTQMGWHDAANHLRERD